MAGRAGRRGIDTVGNVIHLNNLFKNTDLCSYKTMLRGIPQTLVSKFRISYHIVLMNQQPDFIKHSMIHREINNELTQFIQTKNNIETEIANYKNTIPLLKTPQTIIQQYINYTRDVASCVNKKRKEYERSIKSIEEEYKTIKSDKTIIEHYAETIQKHNNIISQIDNIERNITSEHDRILQILIRRGFIEYDDDTANTNTNTRLTLKGQIAANLKEIPCISFTLVIDKLRAFSARELIAIFSCFTNIVVSDDCECKSFKPLVHQSILHEICEYVDEFQDMQDLSSSIHYDLLPYMEKWTSCENTEECKHLLQTLQKEKDICVGDFVKAVLKINNISAEFEIVAEMMGDYYFLSLLKEIPGLTLKYIATNQSLYV
jgi:superfamily II RNA helicase